jgi:hypothetical protein
LNNSIPLDSEEGRDALFAGFATIFIPQAMEKLATYPNPKKVDQQLDMLLKRWCALLDGIVACEDEDVRKQLFHRMDEIDQAKNSLHDLLSERRELEEYIDFLHFLRRGAVAEMQAKGILPSVG